MTAAIATIAIMILAATTYGLARRILLLQAYVAQLERQHAEALDVIQARGMLDEQTAEQNEQLWRRNRLLESAISRYITSLPAATPEWVGKRAQFVSRN